MTGALFVATIGNRDLKLDGNEIRPARIEGEKALSLIAKEAKRFSMPILKPALELALNSGELERIILVVTDQPPTVEASHRNNDTCFFGQVIKTLLESHWKTAGFGQKPAVKIELVRIAENPTFLAPLLFELQGSIYKRMTDERNKGMKQMYLCITGGIPSLNSAVMLLANRVYRMNLNVIRVNDGIASPDPVAAELEKIELACAINSLSQNWHFKHIVIRIDESVAKESPFEQIKILSKAISERLVFDFEESMKTLSMHLAFAGKVFAPVFQTLINELKPLKDSLADEPSARKFLVRELLLNIICKFKHHEYVDVLGRLFRMLEELSFIVLENATGMKFAFSENEHGYPEFPQFVARNPRLSAYLQSKEVDAKRLNILTVERTLDFLKDEAAPDTKQQILEFLQILRRLQDLKQLRNKTIIAHGFKSVSAAHFPVDFVALIKSAGRLVDIEEFDSSLNQAVSSIQAACCSSKE